MLVTNLMELATVALLGLFTTSSNLLGAALGLYVRFPKRVLAAILAFAAGVSLSQTLSGWQLIENQAILLWDEGSLQTYWLDGRRSAPVAGNARGRDLDVAAANKRPAAGCSKETLLQYYRPIDIGWSLSVVP
jgi:hypothetical protein